MTFCTDTWKEQSHFRQDARKGSAKLLKALLRYHKRHAPRPPRIRKPKPAPPRCGRILAIQNAVARYYGIDKRHMLGKHRNWHIAHPRQIAMYLARVEVGASLPLIGKHFNRDHTTVLYACREVLANPALQADLAELRAMLHIPVNIGDAGGFPLKSRTDDTVEHCENSRQERLAA